MYIINHTAFTIDIYIYSPTYSLYIDSRKLHN